ncbi:hypothetical protein ACFX13_028046 [Malus domestica]
MYTTIFENWLEINLSSASNPPSPSDLKRSTRSSNSASSCFSHPKPPCSSSCSEPLDVEPVHSFVDDRFSGDCVHVNAFFRYTDTCLTSMMVFVEEEGR